MNKKALYSLLIILVLVIFTGCNSKKEDILKGKWKAAIEDQKIYNIDGEVVGGEEEYILECDGKGSYDMTSISSDLVSGTYTISKNTVTFKDESREVIAICDIKDKKLDCSKKAYYAKKYVKVEE